MVICQLGIAIWNVEFGWDGPASVSLLLFSIDLVFLCDLGLYGSCPYLYHQAVLVLVVAERERERERGEVLVGGGATASCLPREPQHPHGADQTT